MAMTLRLSDAAEQRLDHLAAVLHLSKNAVIERAVLDLDEQTEHRAIVRAAAARVRTRDAELLDRLSR